MDFDFPNEKIDKAIRVNSKRSPMILDLLNTSSWIPDEKLFAAREFKNRIELARLKTPLTAMLPSLIVVFRKDNLQKPKLRFSFFGFFLAIILICMVLFAVVKRIIDSNFQGNIAFAIFLLLFFAILAFVEYSLTKNVLNKLKNRII